MSATEELLITISPEGETTIEVIGVKGRKCIDLTRFLEEDIGAVKSRRRKKELYEQEPEVSVRLTQRR